MSKRHMVEPRWLDSMLLRWGRTLPGPRGWYSVNPSLQSGIPSTTKNYEPWDITPKDIDDLTRAIDTLEHKHLWAIRLAYKPWVYETAKLELAQYHVTDRTITNWVHEAAEILERVMNRLREEEAA